MSTDDEKISGLYREADAPGPSKTLDDTILKASRKAIEKPAGKGPFSGAWPAAASVAAVIVIAILLVPVLRQEESLKQTEQSGAQKSSSAELADEEQLKLYSVTESMESNIAPSTVREPVMTLQQDTLAEKQATPASSTPTSLVARTPGMSKSSISAGAEKRLEADVDDKLYSRMEAADSAPFAALTPEMWEVKIARLIDDGQLEQARAELEKLEQHFPEHPIRKTLLEKLEP
jgi:hypothetical protein